MRKKHIIEPALIIILIAAIIGATYYYSAQKNGEEKEIGDETATTTVTLAKDKKVDPTANWNSYTNAELGISFKYPKTWSIEVSPGRVIVRNSVRPGQPDTDIPADIVVFAKTACPASQPWHIGFGGTEYKVVCMKHNTLSATMSAAVNESTIVEEMIVDTVR